MAFVTVARADEVPPGGAKPVQAGGRRIALFRVGDDFYALDDECPHRGAPMHRGLICEGLQVRCPWHNARFDLATGRHQNEPAEADLTAYAVRVVGAEVQIDMGSD